jgi:hypothetical protein
MTKKEAEAKLEFLETSDEMKALGLRRIKRRHYTGPPELLPTDMQLKRLQEQLLNDEEFVNRLREKLAV